MTPTGVAKKRSHIERKGLPSFAGRRFITLSLDPEQFGYCPLAGYLAGKEKLRRFLEAGRKAGLWPRGCWWCWKLEFQKNGWAHWHLIINRTAKFSHSQLLLLSELWGLGRTNCRRVSGSSFGYQFKYVFKGLFQDDGDDLAVPQWFANHYLPSVDGNKPVSFARVRFWQTSRGFYTGIPLPVYPIKEKQSSILPRSVSDLHEIRVRSVVICARSHSGRYVMSRCVNLAVDWKGFVRVHLWDVDHSAACTFSSSSFAASVFSLSSKLVTKNELWKLQPLLNANRLTLRSALRLRAAHQQLHRS